MSSVTACNSTISARWKLAPGSLGSGVVGFSMVMTPLVIGSATTPSELRRSPKVRVRSHWPTGSRRLWTQKVSHIIYRPLLIWMPFPMLGDLMAATWLPCLALTGNTQFRRDSVNFGRVWCAPAVYLAMQARECCAKSISRSPL
jgi:hypothetical protein